MLRVLCVSCVIHIVCVTNVLVLISLFSRWKIPSVHVFTYNQREYILKGCMCMLSVRVTTKVNSHYWGMFKTTVNK